MFAKHALRIKKAFFCQKFYQAKHGFKFCFGNGRAQPLDLGSLAWSDWANKTKWPNLSCL